MIDKTGIVWIPGGTGMLGRAIADEFTWRGHPVRVTGRDVSLLDYAAVKDYMEKVQPHYIVMCAAKVGGICGHRDFPVDYMVENLQMELNLFRAANFYGIRKLLFIGSACAYPKQAEVPIKEDALLTGQLEPTNKGYALAKIAGIEMCKAYRKQYGRNFISCMPTNLYGPGDNYDLHHSHVVPGMIRRLHEAKANCASIVDLWGTGTPRREFLYSKDAASAMVHLMYHYDGEETVNVGYGKSYQLSDVADLIAHKVGYSGIINWDVTRPDGTPNRLLDCSKLFDTGWRPQFDLERGLAHSYSDFCKRYA